MADKMSAKMVAALEAAERADGKGGLCYTVAGWIDPSDCWTYHGPVVVSRLVWDRGFLAENGPGRGPKARRVITAKGRAWLAEHREAKAATAARRSSAAPSGASREAATARGQNDA